MDRRINTHPTAGQKPRLIAAAALVALIWLLFSSADAGAISAPIHISGTSGEGVFIRPEPNTSRPPVGWMPEGASPDYNCFAWGQSIGGVPIWFNVNYGGVTGFYASYYDDSSYHSNEELTAKYGVPLCGSAPPSAPAPSAPPPTSPPPAPAASVPTGGPVYRIVDADGGVYFRSSPKWGDTPSTPGKGVYTGDQVQLLCGAFGEAYGPYSNRWWSYVQNLSRPGAGQGWVNAHFIDDGMPANQPSPGEGNCPASVSGTPAGGTGTSPPAAGAIRSVFYWPELSVASRPKRTPFLGVADTDVDYPAWHVNGGCNRSAPVPLQIPAGVNTLAGWSKSRLAPIYFLINSPERRSQIQNIILFDPGSLSEMQGGCDETLEPSVDSVLADWLTKNKTSELMILTGAVSEERNFWGRPQFHGLWNFYLHDIWPLSSSVKSRVKVCDYNGLAHEDVLNDFYQLVKAAGAGIRPDNGCPISRFAPGPIEWSP